MKKLITLIIITGVTIQVYAEDLDLSLKISMSGDNIFFTELSCKKLNNHIDSLIEWTNNTTKQDIDMPEVKQEFSSCKADVTKIIPNFVREILKYKIKRMGPNCFSVAAMSLGIKSFPSHTRGTTLTDVLNSGFCRPLESNESLLAGDFITSNQNFNFFDPGLSKPTHLLVYINKNLGFSKLSMYQNDQYTFKMPQDDFTHIPDRCKNISKAINAPDDCDYFTTHYRCNHKEFKSALFSKLQEPIFSNLFEKKSKLEEKSFQYSLLLKEETMVDNLEKHQEKVKSLKDNAWYNPTIIEYQKQDPLFWNLLRSSIGNLETQSYWLINPIK